MRQLRNSLRAMPMRMAPADLITRLRVVASHEKARRSRMSSFAAKWENWVSDLRLWSHNLARPVALPAFGGIASAVVLFSILSMSPAFAIHGVSGEDVPIGRYTEATAFPANAPLNFADGDIVVDVTFDDDGHMVDFTIEDCAHVAQSPALRKAIESNLLFTEFTPPTRFGQRIGGKIRISFLSSSIDVKG